MDYAAHDATSAWALTQALLVRDPELLDRGYCNSNNLSLGKLPKVVEPY